MMAMLALRYFYLLALVVWLGGLLALGGVVAPAVFAALQQPHGPAAATLGSELLGGMLRSFSLGAYTCGTVMLAALAGMRVLGPKPVQFNLRVGIVATMLAAAVYSGEVAPRRAEARPRETAKPAARALHSLSFNGLHNLSAALMMVDVAGGLVLLYWEARE